MFSGTTYPGYQDFVSSCQCADSHSMNICIHRLLSNLVWSLGDMRREGRRREGGGRGREGGEREREREDGEEEKETEECEDWDEDRGV